MADTCRLYTERSCGYTGGTRKIRAAADWERMRTSTLGSLAVSHFAGPTGRLGMTETHARPAVSSAALIPEARSQLTGAGSLVSVDLVAAAQRSEELAAVPVDELEGNAREYERFLLLARDYPDRSIAPTRAIDRMWHLHMLHPRSYAADCLRLFGDILDHDGGFGAIPEEAPVLADTVASTAAIWEQVFGEAYLGSAVKCTRNCQSRCTRRCKTLSARGDLPSVIDATRLAQRRYSDRLIFLPSAESSAAASVFREPERVFRVLTVLALFGRCDGELRHALDTAFGRAAKWKGKDSPQTLARFKGTRHWESVERARKLYRRHITVGGSVDGERCLQIYYDIAKDGRVEVAWVGAHRPTVSRNG